jgi:hypothetical protein
VCGGEEDAAAAAQTVLEVFGAFATDPSVDIGAVDRWEFCEGHQDAGDGLESGVDNFGWIGLGQGEGEIAHGDSPQSRQGEIEQSGVCAREGVRHGQGRPFERFHDRQRKAEFNNIANYRALAHEELVYFFSPEGRVCPSKSVAISIVGTDSSCSTMSWQIRV